MSVPDVGITLPLDDRALLQGISTVFRAEMLSIAFNWPSNRRQKDC